jgi:hypothetical protein
LLQQVRFLPAVLLVLQLLAGGHDVAVILHFDSLR